MLKPFSHELNENMPDQSGSATIELQRPVELREWHGLPTTSYCSVSRSLRVIYPTLWSEQGTAKQVSHSYNTLNHLFLCAPKSEYVPKCSNLHVCSLVTDISASPISRMSAFERLAPLISRVPDTTEQPKTLMSQPVPLSSPLIKKTPIQIPSFDEKGLVCANADRSFVPIRENAYSQAPRKQTSHEENLSTKIHSSATPSTSTSPAPDKNQISFCNKKPVPRCDTMHLQTTQPTDPSSFLRQVNPSISNMPLPSLNPTSLCKDMTSHENTPPCPIREKDTGYMPNPFAEGLQHDILDQDILLSFTNQDLKRTVRRDQKQILNKASSNPSSTCQNSSVLQSKLDGIKAANIAKSKPQFKNTHSPLSPKTNIKRQQEKVPREGADSERINSTNVSQSTSPPVFDELAPHLSPSLHKRCIQYLQNASLRKPNKQKICKLPESSTILNSNGTLKPKAWLQMEAKRNNLGSNKNPFTSRISSPKEPVQQSLVSASNNCGLSQAFGLSQHQSEAGQMEPQSALLHSDTVSKDCSSQSGLIMGRVKDSDGARTLNQFKTCLPQSQKNFKPASSFPKQKENHVRCKYGVIDTGQNKSQLTQQPQYAEFQNEQASVASCQIDTQRSDVSLKCNSDLQPNVKCEVTTSHRLSPKKNTTECVAEEEPYVTMYCLGSVYVGE